MAYSLHTGILTQGDRRKVVRSDNTAGPKLRGDIKGTDEGRAWLLSVVS